MEKAKSFLFLENKNCLFCSKSFGNSGFVNFTDKGWENVKSNAVKWKRIKVPIDDLCYLFTTVEEKVKDADKAYGGAHKTCRIIFLSKSAVYAKRFGFPNTSLSLSGAETSGTLRQAPKYFFRNDIMANAKAVESTHPQNARWIVDTMATVRIVKPKKIYKKWMDTLLKFATPHASLRPLSLELVNDTYRTQRKEWNKREPW